MRNLPRGPVFAERAIERIYSWRIPARTTGVRKEWFTIPNRLTPTLYLERLRPDQRFDRVQKLRRMKHLDVRGGLKAIDYRKYLFDLFAGDQVRRPHAFKSRIGAE